jgi:hypothetical protein
MPLVRIFVAGGQHAAEFAPLGCLFEARKLLAALEILLSRRLADDMDRGQLDHDGKSGLVPCLLGDVRALTDEGPADHAGNRRVQLHLRQGDFSHLHVYARLLRLGRGDVPLRLRFQQLLFESDIPAAQCLRVLQARLGKAKLRFGLLLVCLREYEGKLAISRGEFEQKIALFDELSGGEVDRFVRGCPSACSPTPASPANSSWNPALWR